MRWWCAWRARRRRQELAWRLAAARRAGHGLHLGEWRLESTADRTLDEQAIVEHLVAWCRDTLATCRRPFGVDHFDLSLAWTPDHCQRPHRAELRRVKPMDLYRPEQVAAQLVACLRGTLPSQHGQAGGLHLVAGLFSWGDATHAALAQTT